MKRITLTVVDDTPAARMSMKKAIEKVREALHYACVEDQFAVSSDAQEYERGRLDAFDEISVDLSAKRDALVLKVRSTSIRSNPELRRRQLAGGFGPKQRSGDRK